MYTISDIESPFDSNTIFYLSEISRAQGDIHPDEFAIVKSSVKKRQREFIAGRTLAKHALEKLGFENYVLRSGKYREPLWPKKIVGSISHSNDYVCTTISNSNRYKGIGVDLEPIEEISKGQQELILTRNEKKWLSKLDPDTQKKLHKVIFSAKESLYKCIFPIVREFIDFQQVDLHVDPVLNKIEICKLYEIPKIKVTILQGGVLTFKDQLLTYITYE